MFRTKKMQLLGLAVMTFTSVLFLPVKESHAALECRFWKPSNEKNVVNVTTASALRSAVAAAKGGETIKLAPGNYGNLNFLSNKKPSSAITIISNDEKNPAIITATSISNASNINLVRLKFFPESRENIPTWGNRKPPLSSFIDNRGVRLPEPPGQAGLSLRNVTGITVGESKFSGHTRGVYVRESRNIRVMNNVFLNTVMDHMTFSDVHNVLIEGNYLGAFKTFWSAHNDAIQFYATGYNKPSSDVTIRNNVITSTELSGSNGGVQGVFIFNEKVVRENGGIADFHKNIVVEDNTIVTSHPNAVVVSATAGVRVRNNTVLADCDARRPGWDPRISVYSGNTQVVLTNNKANTIHASAKTVTQKVAMPANWTYSANTITQACMKAPKLNVAPGCKD